MNFDATRATMEGRPTFEPFYPKTGGCPLKTEKIPDDFQLIVFERDNQQLAFSVRQMAYHHVAQGDFAGEPYLISF
ncbi:MAG: hypothetical protein ACPG7F_20315 [Aggregatilineales bacterium]